MAAECPAVLGTRWRRLPAVASGNYYYNHYDEVLNGAGSTLTVPGFGLKNGVHPKASPLTFVENAILKARNACHFSGLSAIADDSGIEVDALEGAPGVISARYAGETASDRDNLEKLLEELAGVPDSKRSARFHCVLVYLRTNSDPSPIIAQGVWEGAILHQPIGANGFGYDPIFFVPEKNCSSAQLEPDIKNQLSHRAKALKQLKEKFENGARD